MMTPHAVQRRKKWIQRPRGPTRQHLLRAPDWLGVATRCHNWTFPTRPGRAGAVLPSARGPLPRARQAGAETYEAPRPLHSALWVPAYGALVPAASCSTRSMHALNAALSLRQNGKTALAYARQRGHSSNVAYLQQVVCTCAITTRVHPPPQTWAPRHSMFGFHLWSR